MEIVFAASECEPFAKTGGLADVVAELAPELVKLGHKVAVYVPLYRVARAQLGEDLKYACRSITIPFENYNRFVGVVDGGVRDGVQFYLIDCPELFDREGLYGPPGMGEYPNNWERFGLFSRAVIEASKLLGVPDIFHLHDWQAALVAVYLRTVYYFDPLLQKVAAVLTVHNAGYQGAFTPDTVPKLLFPWEVFTFEKVEQNDTFNFLKGGLVYADALTTVSPTYAAEVQTAEFGMGLDGTFRRRSGDLRGILNGADYGEWDPQRDGKLSAHYSAEDLSGKVECRRDLLHAFGLENVAETTAVLGLSSRLVTQKGLDFLATIGDELVKRDIVLVAAGTGEPIYENFLRDLAGRYPARVGVLVRYDLALTHKVIAGADILLMPSRYEPCGLNQLYAMKYGTVPVVRATGGLEDTVEEWDGSAGTGFKYYGYNAWDLLGAVDRALGAFQDKASWEKLMKNGMAKDFGWEEPAREYQGLFKEVLRRRG